jgi:predicted amidohydrolase YtcJ
VGGATAAFYEPYLNPLGTTGIIYMEQDELDETVAKYHDLGLQFSCHAIGDRAIDSILIAYDKAVNSNPRHDHRHRIEHSSMITSAQIQKAKSLNVHLCMNPGFLYYLGDSHIRAIGDRVLHEFPMKSTIDSGLAVTLGSDSPVIDANPVHSLYGSVFRKTMTGKTCGMDEAISMKQALWRQTQAGAYATFEENIKGSISPGKLADFAVLSLDPTKIEVGEAEKLLDMEVVATVLDGELVYGNMG